MKLICQNKKANFEYEIVDRYEAGIKLTGGEIKSIRLGMVNLNDAYVVFKDNRPYVLNMFISNYANTMTFDQKDERRSRELLLNKSEINKLQVKVKTKGLTIVPIKMYFKGQFAKLEIALARGKNLHDKRESIKERDLSRDNNLL